MTNPTSAQLQAAQRLLARAATSTGSGSTLQGYRQLDRALAPIIGAASVRSIFVRSVKLTAVERAALQAALSRPGFANDPAGTLDACLPPADQAELATRVFARFFALLAGFIGERLTTQVMDTAWLPSEETKP